MAIVLSLILGLNLGALLTLAVMLALARRVSRSKGGDLVLPPPGGRLAPEREEPPRIIVLPVDAPRFRQ